MSCFFGRYEIPCFLLKMFLMRVPYWEFMLFARQFSFEICLWDFILFGSYEISLWDFTLFGPHEISWDFLMGFHAFLAVIKFLYEISCFLLHKFLKRSYEIILWDSIRRVYAVCYIICLWDLLVRFHEIILWDFMLFGSYEISWDFLMSFDAFWPPMRSSYEISMLFVAIVF